MESIWDTTFIVVDVETNGSNPIKDRLTEIGCVTVKGGEIISEFSSLINPRQFIPPFITKITGITNEMAFSAPDFNKIADELEKIFSVKNAVFVAHNAHFDWGFVKHTFVREGYNLPTMNTLCTLKLARRLLLPNQKKNVGALASFFGIKMKTRHRALDDAKATASILIELMDMAESEHDVFTISDLLNFQNKQIKKYKYSAKAYNRIEDKLNSLPDQSGVYYYKDKADNILYIGKAKSLRNRVRSYFSNESMNSQKISDMLKKVYDLQWTITNSELEALLLESSEIKTHKPPYNVVAKRYRTYPFISLSNGDGFPKIEKSYKMDNPHAEYYGPFTSSFLVDSIIKLIDKQFKLRSCEGTIKPSAKNKPCFYHHIERCGAPCAELQSQEDYEEEVNKARTFLSGFSGGIIKQLENQMFTYAEELKFEEANLIKGQLEELQKLLARLDEVPTAVNENNLIFIQGNSEREKLVDVMMVRQGMLALQKTIGRRAPLETLKDTIHELYFNGTTRKETFSKEDIDQIKITGSWLHRNNHNGTTVYINGKEEEDLVKAVEDVIRNFHFD